MKKILSMALAAALILPSAIAETTDGSADKAKSELVSAIADTATAYLASDDADLYIYRDMDWDSIADTLPSSFDLRTRGVVPAIRNQGDWGTCWGFASIAACETSMLSTLGMTVEEFDSESDLKMDLSERHLAWFGTSHLPLLTDYADGEYPYVESQAGEGEWFSNEDTSPNLVHYSSGGYMGYASGIFANGMGPQLESDYPYQANDGTSSINSDWSLPEDARYGMIAQLKNSSILPSPAQRDADGNYVYNEAGTEAIKQELLAGRGVSIMYHADQNMTPEANCAFQVASLVEKGYPEDAVKVYEELSYGLISADEMTTEQKRLFMTMILLINNVPADQITTEYLDQTIESDFDDIISQMTHSSADNSETVSPETTATPEEEEARREAATKLGRDYDSYAAILQQIAEAENEVYINADTYAQYTDNPYATADHAVMIVGWDDDYDVSNFPAEHQPPANGAWIVRNSWGEEYGIDGYFYLSYYDQTITFAETFEFVFDEDANTGVSITAYDNMEASAVSSVHTEDPVYLANVFSIDTDSVLSYISVMTTDMDARVIAGVYLLNEDPSSPTDGILLDTVTEDFEFGGYHRIELNYSYQLPAGSVISIVECQRCAVTDGTFYTVPYTNGIGKEAAGYRAILLGAPLEGADISWNQGCIGDGESYICAGGVWYDWKEIVGDVKASDSVAALAEFDNLNIKAYLYVPDGVKQAHNFSVSQKFGAYDALICEDCGEMLVMVG